MEIIYVGHNESGWWTCRGRGADLRSSWGDRIKDLTVEYMNGNGDMGLQSR